MTITLDAFPTVALFLLSLGVASFLLGWEAANHDARRIQRGLSSQLRLAKKQRYELTEWVKTNWPDEYSAYRSGVSEGYQQGVLHAPDLMEEASE